MSGFFGGDTDRMREQSALCVGGAQQLIELVAAAGSAVAELRWTGPDADGFRQSWHRDAEVPARETASLLQRLARELEAHADGQEQASSDDRAAPPGIPPGPLPGPLGGPLPHLPFPGLPLGPGVVARLLAALGADGDGAAEPQEYFGGPGFGDRGQMYDQRRPVGDEFAWSPDLLSGREVDGEGGVVDLHAGANHSAGAEAGLDGPAGTTGTLGARGSLEAGLAAHLDLPAGMGVDASGAVGAEAYAEAGGTIGPDGLGVGARAGAGLYGELATALTHPSGGSVGMTQSAFVGAEAHANGYSHVLRSDEGLVTGFTTGIDAGAFAGAQLSQEFAATSPGGWFSASGAITEAAGAGVDASLAVTLSTDEVSLSAGGLLAAELGLGGLGSVSMDPNAILESVTPGDFDLDDAIGEARGAFASASRGIEDVLGAGNPFD